MVDCCYSETKGVRSFKFEANWIYHNDFLQIVGKGWNEVDGDVEDRVADLVRRLTACRKKLIAWSAKEFPNCRKTIAHLRHMSSNCYKGILTAEKLIEAESLINQMEEAWNKEGRYWWQRSRILWLQCGDRNSKFFHNSVIQRRQRNKVLRLKDVNGEWLEEQGDINKAFSDFYTTLFSSDGGRPMDQALSYVKKVVTDLDNACLMEPVTFQEIESAVFQLGATKAPGPDGFSALFYQTAWKEVSKEICMMV